MGDYIRKHAWLFWSLAVVLQIPLLLADGIFGKCFASFWLGVAALLALQIPSLTDD